MLKSQIQCPLPEASVSPHPTPHPLASLPACLMIYTWHESSQQPLASRTASFLNNFINNFIPWMIHRHRN